MSKAPSQVGTQTVTNTNPTQQAQLPYLNTGWDAAQNLIAGPNAQPITPYGGQTLADWGRPEQIAGYQNLYNTGIANEDIRAAANNPFYQATSGAYGVQNSPAYGGLVDIRSDATRPQQDLIGNTRTLSGIGDQAMGVGNAGNAALQNTATQAGQYGSLYSDRLEGVGRAAGQTGNYYADQLTGQAGQIPGYTAPAQNQLGYNAATATAYNPANPYLQQTASGAYVGANPYLDDTYAAAADATTRSYQTATAPRTDSTYESAGRYGSPSYSNAVTQNEQNLGSSLGNLSADIYGTAYADERALQEQAASTMGSQYLTGVGQSTQAAQAQGQLGLGTAEAQQAGYNMAGQQALQGLNQQSAAQQAASTAGLQGLSQQAAAQQAGSNLGLSGLNAATTANTNAGQLNVADAALINQALGTMQSGYQTGNQQALSASALSPSLIQNGITNAMTQVQAGQGLAGIQQAQLNDEKARYDAQQAAPWTNLSNYMNLIGQPTTGSSTMQQPIYGSPTAQALGTAGAANSMFGNPLGTAGTAAMGSLGFGAPLGASAVAGGAPAVLAPELTASGLSSLAAMNTGATAASMAAPAAMWIICTELTKQGRMPMKHWAVGSRVFAGYPPRGQRGYFFWAIPAVRHLRRKPGSLLSRTLATIFRWRAEDLAARAGVKGARKLWRGRAVTAVLWVPCLALGYLVPEQDWKQVYRDART